MRRALYAWRMIRPHLLGFAALLCSGSVQSAGFNQGAPLLPNPQMTPGDVLTSDCRN